MNVAEYGAVPVYLPAQRFALIDMPPLQGDGSGYGTGLADGAMRGQNSSNSRLSKKAVALTILPSRVPIGNPETHAALSEPS
jgi:hypothetical protein